MTPFLGTSTMAAERFEFIFNKRTFQDWSCIWIRCLPKPWCFHGRNLADYFYISRTYATSCLKLQREILVHRQSWAWSIIWLERGFSKEQIMTDPPAFSACNQWKHFCFFRIDKDTLYWFFLCFSMNVSIVNSQRKQSKLVWPTLSRILSDVKISFFK